MAKRLSGPGTLKLHTREAVRLRPYNDSQGHCTVGWGHLIHKGRCTPADYVRHTLPNRAAADALFAKDITVFEDAVNAAVRVPLADHQFDALVSLCYNIGTGGFSSSTVVRRLNAGDFEGVPAAMMMWTKNKELVGRRQGEVAQFRTPYGNQKPIAMAPQMVPRPSSKFANAAWLHPVFRDRLEALHGVVPFTVQSGGRSRQRQEDLYRAFKAGRGNPANPPGTSWHEYEEDGSVLAQAVDLEPIRHTDAQIHAAAARFGIHFPISKEPWHAQPIEAKSSKRTAGQGLGPVPGYWPPQLIEQEDELVIRFGAKDRPVTLIIDGTPYEVNTPEDLGVIQPGLVAAGVKVIDLGDLSETFYQDVWAGKGKA